MAYFSFTLLVFLKTLAFLLVLLSLLFIYARFLTLAGHTHGGQIRIPYLYKKVIPVRGDVLWDQGLYSFKNEKVFVTSGIGEIGLPMRFLIPPPQRH